MSSQKASKKLVLIDGHAILHRAYHALPPLTGPDGKLLNAAYGFCTMLLKVVNDLKPDYLVVAFDLAKPTFRHEEFIGYQANRPKMDKELSSQIGTVYEILKAMGIPIFTKEGYEADDVIGTLSQKASSKNVKTVIVTGDRDIFQLVNKKTRVYIPLRGLSEARLFDEKEVEKKMGISPSQIVDYKALVGDASDNYPGVLGIGPKTASKLLKEFDNFEKIYKNLDKVEEKFGKSVKKKLEKGRDAAELSRKLAEIITDIPIKLNLTKAQFKFTEKEREKTIEKLEELGFKSLVKRLKKEEKEKEEQLGFL